MKSLKTYNMDHDVIKILSRQPNKSQFVNSAVRNKAHNIEEIFASDFDTRTLCIALKDKSDIPENIRRELIHFLYETL